MPRLEQLFTAIMVTSISDQEVSIANLSGCVPAGVVIADVQTGVRGREADGEAVVVACII